MDTVPGLKSLLARKSDLLLESELNRQTLRVEAARLRLRGERLRDGLTSGQGWWKLAAPVAGFLLARRLGKGTALVAKSSLLVSLLGAAWKFWNNRAPASPSNSVEP